MFDENLTILNILTKIIFLHKIFQKSEAGMCLVMCLKNQEFRPVVYKTCVYKKNVWVIVKSTRNTNRKQETGFQFLRSFQ